MPNEGAKPAARSKKTSKTARVLGLLTSPPPTEDALPQTAPPPAPPEDPVENQVRSALEQELGKSLADLPEPPSPPPPLKPEEPPKLPEPVLAVKPAGPQSEGGASVICYNVMQALVEQKADKYIRLFGLCTCPRCRIDVIALSLTNLPAKYVVVPDQEVVPLLSVYEGQYNAAIVSQVMNACKQVMEHPRHDQ